MIERRLSKIVQEKAKFFPVVSVTGPRQSGKTTLCKMAFPEYSYYNLEAPDTFAKIQSDPRAFLTGKKGVVLDEVQKMPELFSYIQVISDEQARPGQFILSGSQQFLLQHSISQSLAGRVYNATLLPPDFLECTALGPLEQDLNTQIYRGFYLRVLADSIPPSDYYPNYIQTYVERDVRNILRIGDLNLFQRFMRILAGRAGKLINLSAIGLEVGVDHKTIRSWLSVLESSFLIFFLPPYERNFNKRIIKTPKLYFYDTGLLCSLLGINQAEVLEQHWARGELFENLVISNIQKRFLHQGIQNAQLYFWRDQTGNEVDCLFELNGEITAIEIKSSSTYKSEFLKGLRYFKSLKTSPEPLICRLIYGGAESWDDSSNQVEIRSWMNS